MKEFRWWIFASFMLFAISFIERAGRPLLYLAIALFFIGIFSWLETEYKEYEKSPAAKRKRKEDFIQAKQVVGSFVDNLPERKTRKRKIRQPRDSHGRFIKKRRK